MAGHADQFRIGRSVPDPIEGLWETGEEFMTVNLATVLSYPNAGQRFVTWLRTSPDITPNAAGALLLLLTARLELRQQQSARAARNQRPTVPPRWTTHDLAQWLEAPLPTAPPRVDGIISLHRLWK
jgi:hypothetical protein